MGTVVKVTVNSLYRSQPITANPGLYHAIFLLFVVKTRYAPGRGNITATAVITCMLKKRCNKDILLLSVQTPCFEPQSFSFPLQCPGVSDDVKSRWFLVTLMVLFCDLKGLKCIQLNFYFQQFGSAFMLPSCFHSNPDTAEKAYFPLQFLLLSPWAASANSKERERRPSFLFLHYCWEDETMYLYDHSAHKQ